MAPPLIELVGVTKRFGTFVANDSINLRVNVGEIHAIVGENGAGKSTLMKTLAGLQMPDEGRILLRGVEVSLRNPDMAMNQGIAMVHQHFSLVDSLTVAENIVISNPPRRAGLFLRHSAEKQVAELSETYGLAVNPRQRLGDCRVGVRQRVEILKALYRNPDVLILDEPTAVLTPQETQSLLAQLRHLKARGKTIIFITHKLKEVMALADRVTVMRAGRVTLGVDISETSPNHLATAMVGHEILAGQRAEAIPLGAELARLEAVGSDPDTEGGTRLDGVSLTLRQGEIVGIAGVEGNGQSELIEVIAGMRKPRSGRVRIKGVDVTAGMDPAAMRKQGVAHIPEDRIATGLAPTAPLLDNMIMGAHRTAPVGPGAWIDKGQARAHAARLVKAFDVRPGNLDATAGSLSGGNMQKAIFARELAGDPDIIIAAHPTRGVDIGAAEFIYEQLLSRRKKAGIILISSDLDEILRLSDRIVVMYQGRIMAEAPPHLLTPETLGLLMAGIKPDTPEHH
jgi:ABC-type uncharacterized transport system ATPase subunit